MASGAPQPEALRAVACCFPHGAVPRALVAASPATRLASEFAAYASASQGNKGCCCAAGARTPMLSLDVRTMERDAVITDVGAVERAEWWLARRRGAAAAPVPLRSLQFCLRTALEPSVEHIARVPLCAATVTTLNLNARCDSHNHISSLAALSRLARLRELLMKHTTVLQCPRQLPMTVSADLHAVFRNLRKLVVGDYYLVQHLPLHDLRELEEVDLSGTGVNDEVVLALSSCRRVRALSLSGCMAVDHFAPLTALTGLTQLDVSHTRIDGAALRELCRRCPGLRCVALNNCGRLADLSPLEHLTQLRCVHVARTRLRTADLARLCALPELEELHIPSCRAVEDFTPIARLQTLLVLNVRDTWIDGAGIEAASLCDALQWLDVSFCPAVEGLAPLARLSWLEELHASGTHVTDACLRALCTDLTRLRVLLLNGCRLLRDFTPLRCAAALQEVGACDTAFGDAAVAALAQCPLLRTVHLHVCVGVASLAPLMACPNLQHVGIGGTRLAGPAFEHEVSCLEKRGVRLSRQLVLVTTL